MGSCVFSDPAVWGMCLVHAARRCHRSCCGSHCVPLTPAPAPPPPLWKAKVGLPKMPTSQFPKTAKMCTIHGKGEPRWHVEFKLLIREIILGHPDGPVSPQRWERWRKSPCQSEVAWLHRPWLALKGEGGKQSPRNTAAVTRKEAASC